MPVAKTNREVRLEAALQGVLDHVTNIGRQLKHLENDALSCNLTTQSAIDYVNQIRSITSQILHDTEQARGE